MVNYTLRRVEPALWDRVKERAASEGRSIRFVLITALRLYAEHGFHKMEHIITAGDDRRGA